MFLQALVFSSATNDSCDDKNFYTAAVVEYVHINASSTKETILTNLYQYEKIIIRSKKSVSTYVVNQKQPKFYCFFIKNFWRHNNIVFEKRKPIVSFFSHRIFFRTRHFAFHFSSLSSFVKINSLFLSRQLLQKSISNYL